MAVAAAALVGPWRKASFVAPAAVMLKAAEVAEA
jgi:hypothetical protein